MPKITSSLCKLCGTCVQLCPMKLFTVIDNKLNINGNCILCKACEYQCPNGAIITK